MLTENGRLKMPSILAELPRKTTAEPEDKQEHENWRRSEGTKGDGEIETRPRRPRSIEGL